MSVVTITRARGNRVRVTVPRGAAWPRTIDIHVAIGNSEILRKRGTGPLRSIKLERFITSCEAEFSYATESP